MDQHESAIDKVTPVKETQPDTGINPSQYQAGADTAPPKGGDTSSAYLPSGGDLLGTSDPKGDHAKAGPAEASNRGAHSGGDADPPPPFDVTPQSHYNGGVHISTETLGRTPAEEISVGRNSAAARAMFPKAGDDDFDSPQNAAYRYLMNKEGVDNYSSSAANDKKILEAADPNSIKKLDAIVAADEKNGPVAGAKSHDAGKN